MKAPKPNDFTVNVPDLGKFTFARRTLRDELAISAEFARLSEGAPVTGPAALVMTALADLVVLTVGAPDGLDPDSLLASDATDGGTFDRALAIWGALRDKEDTFRAPRAKPAGDAVEAGGSEAAGEAAGGNLRDLVSPPVQLDP